jgi:PIN domain nuclease of toxin-antitoxin system
MRVLIDTHTFLWFINDNSDLSSSAKDILESDSDVLLSIASIWEIAIKLSIGKLSLPAKFSEFIPEQIQINQIDILPIEVIHLEAVSSLPLYHRDPFDRLLIAQGISEQVSIISADKVFDLYPVQRLW